MAASPSNRVFFYPDPSLFGLKAPSPQSHPYQSTVSSEPNSPAAPALFLNPNETPNQPGSNPYINIDPTLLALPGPTPVPHSTPVGNVPAPAPAAIAGPIPAQFAGAPRLSVVGVMFPGFPAGLVPPMEINGGDAAKYNELVAGMLHLNLPRKNRKHWLILCVVAFNTTNAGLKSGKAYESSQSVDDR